MEETVSIDEKGQSSSQLGADGNTESDLKKDKKSPESYSLHEKFHDETFAEKKLFKFREAIYLKMQGCTFEEDAHLVFSEDTLINWKGCTFKKKLYVDCTGKGEFNIQNCDFLGGVNIFIHQNSSLLFSGNYLFDKFIFTAYEKIDLMIKRCQFKGETKLDLRDDGVLKFEVNDFREPVDIKVFGEAKATFRKNSFLEDSKISFRDNSIFIFKANECQEGFELRSNGKIDSTVERNIFQNSKLHFSNDAILRFESNVCYKDASFQIQGDADVNIQKCTFDGSSTLAIHDKDPIALQKNVCAGEILFGDNEHIKLVVERNSFKKESLVSQLKLKDKSTQVRTKGTTPSFKDTKGNDSSLNVDPLLNEIIYLFIGLFVLIFLGFMHFIFTLPDEYSIIVILIIIPTLYLSNLELDHLLTIRDGQIKHVKSCN